MTTITSSQFNPQIIRFPKDGKPSLAANEWQVWNGVQDEGGIPDLEHGAHKVLVPFHWWITHHKNADIIERARQAFDPAFTRKSVSDQAMEVLRKVEEFSERENKDAEMLARYALVNGSDIYRSAFKDWIKAAAKGNTPVFTPAQVEAVRASMSLTSANGGYALPTLFDPTLIQTGTMTKNPIRRISRVEQGMVDQWNGVTAGNVTTYWKGEGSAFTDGSPTLGAASVNAAMLTAYVTGSFEIFQDTNLLGQLPGLIGTAVDMAEGVAFVSGSGSDAPKGIITAISATVGSTVTATTRGTFNSTSGVDTIAMFNALPSRYEDTSTWLMNKATYVNVAQQTFGTAGGKIIDMTNKDVILDSPVKRASSVTSTTTSGNIVAVLGDFSEFIIYDRLGINVEFMPIVVDGSGLPTGQRGLVAYKRVGSDAADPNAFRFLKA